LKMQKNSLPVSSLKIWLRTSRKLIAQYSATATNTKCQSLKNLSSLATSFLTKTNIWVAQKPHKACKLHKKESRQTFQKKWQKEYSSSQEKRSAFSHVTELAALTLSLTEKQTKSSLTKSTPYQVHCHSTYGKQLAYHSTNWWTNSFNSLLNAKEKQD